jgi:UDP-galactopyranose mutase
MARVVVVGGGFAGMAAAARLAKLRHEVTLLERREVLGGALEAVRADEFTWDAGPHATLLPAVVRDLFRKSGRPLERELDLQPLDHVHRHRFADGTTLALPGRTRAGQLRAFEALSPGLGHQWVAYVEAYGDTWELLRKEWFEREWDPVVSPREVGRVIDARTSLHRRLARALSDERARLVAAQPLRAAGHDPRHVPAWAGVATYLEQRFGAWTVPGGLAALGEAMAQRLTTRRVEVRTGVRALDLVVAGDRVRAVRTDAGEVAADIVVVAVDPHLLPALRPFVRRNRSTTPPAVLHLGLDAVPAALPTDAAELVLHPASRREPTVSVRAGTAPVGAAALSLHLHGVADDHDPAGDLDAVLGLLAARGVDLRGHVVTALGTSAGDLRQRWGQSPWGTLWEGPRTARSLLGPRTPITGVYAAGAHATAGPGLPFAGLSAALVVAAVGAA